MQYVDYIANYHARRDRAEQLANHYNQKPASKKVQNLWMHSVEKHSSLQSVNITNVAGIIAAFVIGLVILVLLVFKK